VTDFLGVATGAFRKTAFRATAFFGVRGFATAFFLTMDLVLALLFKETFALLLFRAAAFCATALFAFGRAAFGAAVPRLAADLGEVRWAATRDGERLNPLVTALISKLGLKGKCGHSALEVAVAE
jgi:hypothetical protein